MAICFKFQTVRDRNLPNTVMQHFSNNPMSATFLKYLNECNIGLIKIFLIKILPWQEFEPQTSCSSIHHVNHYVIECHIKSSHNFFIYTQLLQPNMKNRLLMP